MCYSNPEHLVPLPPLSPPDVRVSLHASLPSSPHALTPIVSVSFLWQNRTARTLKSCNIPFFATLSESTFQLIAEVAHVMTFDANDMVFRVRTCQKFI